MASLFDQFNTAISTTKQLLSFGTKTAKKSLGGAVDHWGDEPSLLPEDTAWHAAATEVEDRVALALKVADLWKKTAFASVAVSTILGGGWFYQAQKSTVQRVFVETSGEQIVKVHMSGRTEPNFREKAGEVQRAIWNIFTKDDSGPINVGIRKYIVNHIIGKAVVVYNERIVANDDPQSQREVRNIRVYQSVYDEMVWEGEWQVREWKDGRPSPWKQYKGQFTLDARNPENVEEIFGNATGLFIVNMSWSDPEIIGVQKQ